MSRYRERIQSATAIAVDTAFFYLTCPAGSGYVLRRVTGGLATVGSAGAPPDQNCSLGIAPATGAPVGAPTNTGTVVKERIISPANLAIPATSFATTAPTFGASATDPVQIPCSSRGGFDLYFEDPDGWEINVGTANGLAFVNRVNALTTPLAWVIDVVWEE